MAASNKSIRVGIIAEDASDIDTLKIILSKINPSVSPSVKKRLGHGCGKIRRKMSSWAQSLRADGCKRLLIVHDCDRHDTETLRKDLISKLGTCPITNHLILIPTEELEAWLLCDPLALRECFSLKKLPRLPASPEAVSSPKEFLEALVFRESKGNRRYLNTAHNAKIMQHVEISKLRKCSEFLRLESFWLTS
jgi:hypothetical protein